MPKHQVLKMARELTQPFRPVEVADLDGAYHSFIVRYSGDYVTHSHSADEFIYILEGAIEVDMDQRTLEVRQGEALLIPAGKPHRPRCKGMALALVFETKGLQVEGRD
ncbi:cupin domain-containing protein [bacterium]|nr:cupin domain-containing protein [bacterium]HPF33896.1 cupin domain-containing protein [Candidatus Krumholzibacteria bacterium]HRX50484.1 cupin domain-containing protein [Candidatus Krumholzibacteria bacterium]